MPKNIIEQRDETGSVLDIVASNTVFIPIETAAAVEPILVKSVAELDAAFLTANLVTDTELEYSDKLGYNLAKPSLFKAARSMKMLLPP